MTYRAYFLNDEGHVDKPPVLLDCASDEQATQKARSLLDGHDVEVWDENRRVALLKAAPRKQPI
jgi:hypothetical protein